MATIKEEEQLNAAIESGVSKVMDKWIEVMARTMPAMIQQVAQQQAPQQEVVQVQQREQSGDLRSAEGLELFSCKGNLLADEWIRRFELAKTVGRWSEAKTKVVLMTKLSGAARQPTKSGEQCLSMHTLRNSA